MQRRSIYIILILWCASFKLGAQQGQLNFQRLSVEQGLSQSSVYAIIQDETGYLWFGTADGLNRFNGYEFKQFRYDLRDPKAITNSFIHCLNQSSQGGIWVGTGGGISIIDPYSGESVSFRNDPENPRSLGSDYIFSIIEDRNGSIWLATKNGLDLFDSTDSTFLHFPFFDRPDQELNVVFEASNGQLLLGSNYGVLFFDPILREYKPAPESLRPIQEHAILSIIQDKESNIWIGSDFGVYVYNTDWQLLKHIAYGPGPSDLSHELVNCFLQYDDRYMWMGTNDGLNILDMATGIISKHYYSPYDKNSLSDNAIIKIIKDRSGVIWLGTHGGGLNKYDKYQNGFRLHQHQKGNLKSLNHRMVFSIIEDSKGIIWVGTEGGGVNRIERSHDSFGRPDYTYSYISRTEEGNTLSSNKVYCMLEDSGQVYWIGTLDGGLNAYDAKANRFKVFRNTDDKHSLPDDNIYSLLLDSRGRLWVGTDFGLALFNKEDQTFKTFHVALQDLRSFSSNAILDIYEDSKNQIWVGSFGGGLSLLDEDKGVFKSYVNDINDSSSLSSNNVMSLFEDSRGNFWVCTFGGGLNLFDQKNGTFQSFSQRDGLPNNVVYGVLEDDDGRLWASSNKGLFSFDIQTHKVKSYNVNDGLQSDEFNQGAFFKDKEGRMYFGGINGFNSFRPDDLQENRYIPEIDIEVYNKPEGRLLSKAGAFGSKAVSLSYRNNFLFLDYVAFNYVNSAKNQYAYMLEGLSDEWIYVGSRRSTAFSNLEPGEYRFRVKASNNDGYWNEAGESIAITIRSPFWKKWWFIPFLSIVILLVFFVIALLYLKNAKALAQKELIASRLKLSQAEKDALQYRLTSLRAQMDPHFIFNSLNSIQHFISQNDPSSARAYLSKFSALIRRILSNSREDFILLEDELKTISLYLELEALRFDKRFSYEVKVDEQIDPEDFKVPTLLIQPYVENAIWHGLMNKKEGGQLTISLSMKEGHILCTIEDNGVGRKKAGEIKENKQVKYESLGMIMNKNRMELIMEGHEKPVIQVIDLFDNQGKASGTRVEIWLPMETSLAY